MKVLVTGFEPFGELKTNTSEDLVQFLLTQTFSFDLVGAILPVSFNRAIESVETLIQEHNPNYVVSFGVARQRAVITPERLAVNYIHSKLPDNDGNVFMDKKIDDSATENLHSSLPLDSMVQASINSGVDSKVSDSAGTYVCNDLMYKLIKMSENSTFKAGFIHIPSLDDNRLNGHSKLNFEEIGRGVSAMLKVL